jgi:3-hydroxy-5-methyl-1-naphthoate 3-O-methyltransferase
MSEQSEPLSDRVVKIRQIDVLSIAEGFFQSSVLFALLKLRIFERIDEGAMTLDRLASEVGARPETLSRLLNAGVVLKLLESKDGIHFGVSPACRTVLMPSAGEHYLGDWIRTLDFFCGPLQKLDEAVLKSGPTIDPATHLGGDKERSRSFALSMHNYACLRGKELATFLNTEGSKSLLDVGCGPGTYSFHLGAKNADLELYLADHPVVLETAKEIESSYGLPKPVHYLPLDALGDEIPGSYDIILISNVLHGLGEKASRKLIKRLYGSVNPGGSLVIQAQFMRDDRLGSRWSIFLDLVQLCVTAEGRNHALGETARWLEDAGFTDVEYQRMTLLNTNSFLRGYKR